MRCVGVPGCVAHRNTFHTDSATAVDRQSHNTWKRFLLVIVITRAAVIGGPGPALLPLLSFHADEARAQELLLLNLLSDDGLPRRDLILQGDNGAHHFLNQLEPTKDLRHGNLLLL
jgi:hypothetical protein